MSLVDPTKSIPTTNSDSKDWIVWYMSLRETFTKEESNYLFLKAWKQRGNSDANDSNLRDYLQKKGGISLEADFTDFAWVTNPIEGVSGWIKQAGNTVLIAAGVILLLVFVLAYELSKNTKLNVPII